MLAFAADHRLVLASQVAVLAGCSERSVRARLGVLTDAKLLTRRSLFYRQAACYQVTGAGLAAAGSSLPRPRLDLRCYLHDVGCAWLWLGARAGAFGPAADVVSERRLRSHDGRPDRDGPPLGVRLGGYGPHGREQLHYPDLVVRSIDGRQVAIELELTGKGQGRRERILGGYGADNRIDAVVYLAPTPSVVRNLRTTAAALGLTSLIQVRPLAWSGSMAELDRHLAGTTVATGRRYVARPATERGR